MKIKKTKTTILTFVILSLFVAPVLFAQQTPPPDVDPWSAVETITNLVFGVLLAVAVLAIIYAGFLFITAQGEGEKVSRARNTLMYAIVGIVVALLARGLVNYLHELFQ